MVFTISIYGNFCPKLVNFRSFLKDTLQNWQLYSDPTVYNFKINILRQFASDFWPPKLYRIKIFAIVCPYSLAKKNKKRTSSYILFLLQLLSHMGQLPKDKNCGIFLSLFCHQKQYPAFHLLSSSVRSIMLGHTAPFKIGCFLNTVRI